MPLTRRAFIGAAAAGLEGLCHAAATPPITPDQAHRELVQGNQRFASGHARHPHSSRSWMRKAGQTSQHPHAVVLCCSDSRVVPEILFDLGIGDVFTVRVAGNVVNEDEIASIEYAVEHLGVPLCVVLGHSKCGAVTAVVEAEPLPVEIDHLVVHIREALTDARQSHPGAGQEELIPATIRANVSIGVDRLRTVPRVLREFVDHRKLRIEGAVYDLQTGRVSWL